MKEKTRELRDDAIRELLRKGYKTKDISELFDISRQRIAKVMHRTDEEIVDKKERV